MPEAGDSRCVANCVHPDNQRGELCDPTMSSVVVCVWGWGLGAAALNFVPLLGSDPSGMGSDPLLQQPDKLGYLVPMMWYPQPRAPG